MTKALPNGTVVTVLPPYTGHGTYGHDSATGERFIVGNDEDRLGVQNYRVSRVNDPARWEHIVHVYRIQKGTDR